MGEVDRIDSYLGRGVEKLAGTVEGIVDFIAGPKRIVDRANARASAELIAAEAEAKKSEIAQRTADRLRDREFRRQHNVESITAYAAEHLQLPGPISDDPVTEDFVYRFFDEAQDIGDKEMQRLWGKLLAGEVRSPGTFKPRTLRVLKDMTRDDAVMLSTLSRFVWMVEKPEPVILNHNEKIYSSNGITFEVLSHLSSAGLILFEPINGYGEEGNHPNVGRVTVSYFGFTEVMDVAAGGSIWLPVGTCLFTLAGRELFQLCEPKEIVGFREFVLSRWTRFRQATAVDADVPSASA